MTNKTLLEQLVDCVVEDKLTGLILKDIMCTNFNFESIKKALDEKLEEMEKLDDSNAMSIFLVPEEEEKKDETEEEKKIRIGYPKDTDIWMLMASENCEEQIPNLKDNDIDAEQFWNFEDGDLKDLLQIEIYGRRQKLLRRMKDVKEEHAKKMEEIHKLSKKINKDGMSELLLDN